jgi:hypothetical protein
MADVQSYAGIIDIAVKGITILLMIIAASMAIKKKNNIALGIVIVGNLAAYYFTQSPLLCMIISIAGIIWVSSAKSPGAEQQNLGSSKSQIQSQKKNMAGNIIGLILGIGFVTGPLIGYLRQEASLSDPTTQGVLILFAVIGCFMIINNLFKLFEGAPAATTTVTQSSKAKTGAKESNKIRCRFCGKRYSAEYNGCPYCKKK